MLQILFGFEGRIGRRNYLLAIVGQWAVLTGMFFAFGTALLSVMGLAGFDLTPGATAPVAEEMTAQEAMMASGIGVASIIFIILVLGVSIYMGLAAQAKRLHDMNMSGWLTLINFASLPIAMTLVASDPANGPIALFVMLAPVGLGVACLFFPGTRGPNQYGEDRLRLFDLPDRSGETWADRAQAHRQSLREKNETSRETTNEGRQSDDGSDRPRRARRTQPAAGARSRGGFGKRGMA